MNFNSYNSGFDGSSTDCPGEDKGLKVGYGRGGLAASAGFRQG